MSMLPIASISSFNQFILCSDIYNNRLVVCVKYVKNKDLLFYDPTLDDIRFYCAYDYKWGSIRMAKMRREYFEIVV